MLVAAMQTHASTAGAEVARLRKWHVWCLLAQDKEGDKERSFVALDTPEFKETKGVQGRGFERRSGRGFEHVKN